MSLSSELQNFIFNLHTIENTNFFTTFIQTSKFLFTFVVNLTFSLFSFEWLNTVIFRINTLPLENLKLMNQSFLGLPQFNIFQEHLLNINYLNPVFIGCYNAIFICLPLSISHLYSIRETIIKNNKVGNISYFNTVIGITTYTYLCKFEVFNFLTKGESILYLLSLIVILVIIYRQNELEESVITVSGSLSFQSQANWKQHLLIPILLSWIEQIIYFPYLISIGDPFNNLYNGEKTIGYGIGLLLGLALGTLIFTTGLKQLCQFLWNLKPINPRIWRENANVFMNVIILIFVFATIPYYTLDFLTTNGVGLYSKEKILNENIINYTQNLRKKNYLFNITTMDIESFDTKQSNLALVPIEDVLYRGEKDVINRTQRQMLTVEEKAKNWMQNILAKLGIELKNEEKNNKNTENTERTLESNKLETSNIIPSPILARRFQQYGKFENNPLSTFVTQTSFIDNSTFSAVSGLSARIKTKYYENPVYQSLLKGDINLFLLNQEKFLYSSNSESIDIERKQKALKAYTNSIRKYKNLPYNTDFYNFFEGSKSFSNKLISHQAKGSLRIVRRLFRIDLKTSSSILSYNQSLYSQVPYEKASANLIHEELPVNKINNLKLENWQPVPLYAGWDANRHEYVITNRYLFTNSSRKENDKLWITNFPAQTTKNYKFEKSLNNILSIPNQDPRFQKAEAFIKTPLKYTTAPITISFSIPETILPPDRGIFLWYN